jgi:thioredoxin 1
LNYRVDDSQDFRGGSNEGESSLVKELESVKELDSHMKSLAADSLIVIDFSASWCGPCKMIAPYYDELSTMEEFSTVSFVKVDVDKAADIARKYSVASMPTFIFLKNGKVIDQFSGASVQKLVTTIQKHMK